MMMRYKVEIAVFENGSYKYTETIESGENELTFTAEEWYRDACDEASAAGGEFGVKDNEWWEIEVRFYAGGEEPVYTDSAII